MNSCVLSNTGLPVPLLVAVGLVLLLAGVGAFLVFGARGRRARTGGALVLLLVVAGVLGVAGGGEPAHAAPAAAAAATAAAATAATAATASAALPTAAAASGDCPDGTGGSGSGGSGGGANGGGAENSLTIIQTSVNNGIGPGREATTLVGTITNHGTASPYITEVTVSIGSVTKAPGAVDGVCDVSDYVLQDASMPVGRTLAPEEAAGFNGASIGFSDKGTNQDACKNATLNLVYVSS